ncbi:MAG: TetR/AcrR family transcriptional regulator [Acidimicrobiia bacterium]|nr:TetR/AcrR family transcriptional regulator [Acidimicrobiia bacterium]
MTVKVVQGDDGHAVRRTQAERRASTRAALLAAARELFAAKGFAGAGREEIVERAGVTRGAMYHHFASKEALFQAVYEACEEDVLGRVVIAAAAGGDPKEMLRLGSLAYLDVAAAEDVRRICLIDAPAVLPTELRRELSERFGLGVIRDALTECMEAGLIGEQPVDPLAHLLLAMLLEAATLVAEGADRVAVGAVLDHVLDSL